MNDYQEIVKKYPKLFNKKVSNMPFPMFGFECGNGWFNLLNHLCMEINGHIVQDRMARARALRFNRALNKALNGNDSELVRYYQKISNNLDWVKKAVNEDIFKKSFRTVIDKVNYIRIDQVKEKFGGLRFYYSGGDSYIDGMVRMAESLSYSICEVCGNSGKPNRDGWIRTLCDEHKKDSE